MVEDMGVGEIRENLQVTVPDGHFLAMVFIINEQLRLLFFTVKEYSCLACFIDLM